MDTEILRELLVEQIRDMYDAEKQLTRALPKMAKAASSGELQEAIRNHLDETQQQVARLENVFGLLNSPARGKSCKGMQGLIEEGSQALKEEDEGDRRDLAIIAAAQRVEHYEMSAYGTARTMAEVLELPRVVELLQMNEEEEKAADRKLTEVAMGMYQQSSEQPQMPEMARRAGSRQVSR
jgi:ferritin-like metal-binding protein YciE